MPNAETVELYVDGGSRGNPGPGGGGFAVVRKGKTVLQGSRFFGKVTNNQAEYQALICGLEAVKKTFGAPQIRCFMDSQLAVEQLNGRYKVKNANIRPLFLEVQQLVSGFPGFTVFHIPREQNALADALANRAMDRGAYS